MRGWIAGAVLAWLMIPVAAAAQPYRLLASDGEGGLSCVTAPECEDGGICPMGLSCAPGPDPAGRGACFPAGIRSTSFVYCCGLEGETCPMSDALGPIGRCTPVAAPDGAVHEVCIYDGGFQDFCTGHDMSSTPSPDRFVACASDGLEGAHVIRYPDGDCDRDTELNKLDPCPCDETNSCVIARDAGTMDVDGGNVMEPDAGLAFDAGPTTRLDAGPTVGSAPPLRFHGAGGCACTVTARASPSRATLLVVVVAVAAAIRGWRRRARRCPPSSAA